MILSVDGVHFSYPGRDVLKEISFSVCQGDCISILGKNGTGKSTLLKCSGPYPDAPERIGFD